MRMWASLLDCSKIVEDAWKHNVTGCPQYVSTQKLKQVKLKLKEWNKEVFGNVNDNVNSAMQKLESIQQDIDIHGGSDSLLNQEHQANVIYSRPFTFKNNCGKISQE